MGTPKLSSFALSQISKKSYSTTRAVASFSRNLLGFAPPGSRSWATRGMAAGRPRFAVRSADAFDRSRSQARIWPPLPSRPDQRCHAARTPSRGNGETACSAPHSSMTAFPPMRHVFPPSSRLVAWGLSSRRRGQPVTSIRQQGSRRLRGEGVRKEAKNVAGNDAC